MLENVFNGLNKYIEYKNGNIASLIVEIILGVAIFIASLVIVGKASNNKKAVILLIINFILIVASLFFGMYMLAIELVIVYACVLGIIVVAYGKKTRRFVDIFLKTGRYEANLNEDEKSAMIKTLVKTSEYLSRRKVGALISIERNDNLDQIIDNAISINGDVSQELLTTIFTVGTACHDGAVIIRGNKIVCAAAYLPSTDKYDVPKSYGTRHRAAIGVSERYDCITIVVSEETGYISYTIDGNMFYNITPDKLEETLNSYIKNN